jgi:hypothetical protein
MPSPKPVNVLQQPFRSTLSQLEAAQDLYPHEPNKTLMPTFLSQFCTKRTKLIHAAAAQLKKQYYVSLYFPFFLSIFLRPRFVLTKASSRSTADKAAEE